MVGESRESGDVNELTRNTPLAADSNPVPPHFMSIILLHKPYSAENRCTNVWR
jgi:hypothetical protein